MKSVFHGARIELLHLFLEDLLHLVFRFVKPRVACRVRAFFFPPPSFFFGDEGRAFASYVKIESRKKQSVGSVNYPVYELGQSLISTQKEQTELLGSTNRWAETHLKCLK